jgi:hypothetical protein
MAVLAAAVVFSVSAGQAAAEPMFLSKGFPRCTSCHYSPTGGALLNDVGRVMSHTQLPTFPAAAPPAVDSRGDEQAFLWGVLGEVLDPVRLGIGLRPSYLHFRAPGMTSDRNLLMQADLQGAWQSRRVTLYGSVGRRVEGSSTEFGSYEHWAAFDVGGGMRLRAGRYLPAYGVRFSDHTYFSRRSLGFDQDDEVYGVEVSHAAGRSFVQVTASPGRAESIADDDGTRAFTSSARLQFDLAPRVVLVASGVFRGASDEATRSGSGGVAFGISPGPRWAIWTQLDRQSAASVNGGASWVTVNETSFEAVRGLWLKVSPQYRTGGAPGVGDIGRVAMAAVWIPRTHWNVNVSYYRDRNRLLELSTSTVMAQLHLFP